MLAGGVHANREQGRIAWARMLDPNGVHEECRPGVVVTPSDPIKAGEPFVGVAISSTFTEPLSRMEVRLPWNRDKSTVKTRLRKPVVAQCDWLASLTAEEIVDLAGVVPQSELRQIRRLVRRHLDQVAPTAESS